MDANQITEETTAIGRIAADIERRSASGDLLGLIEVCEAIIASCNVALGRAMIQMSRARYMELLLKEKELFRRQMKDLGRVTTCF